MSDTHGPAVSRLVVGLARVVVPPYLRVEDGSVEDVSGYTYDRKRVYNRDDVARFEQFWSGRKDRRNRPRRRLGIRPTAQMQEGPPGGASEAFAEAMARAGRATVGDVVAARRRKGRPPSTTLEELRRLRPQEAAALERGSATRSLSVIAADIRRNWPKVNFAAKPYLDAMDGLQSIEDNYGLDSAREIVARFLANASQFRGPEAKRIKDELKALLKGA